MTQDGMPFEIVTLRERPEFVSVVRDRLWHAWWQDEGETLHALDTAISECLDADAIPTTFVAVAGDALLGTVSLILVIVSSDEETLALDVDIESPKYSDTMLEMLEVFYFCAMPSEQLVEVG